ncbi:MAG: hypothetical protein H0X25_10055 [Acidobacteriales bacterium]|nr:hypothetical protein [Terriglobales bacterium]
MAKVRLGWLLAGIVAVAGCAKQAGAIPAFARKYNLPCSACHEAWPKLNNFGQVFRDNGFQLMNDRDSPIYQSPSYWPIMFRTTPQWHHETNTGVPIDNTPGNAGSGQHEATVKTSGFDFTGVDIFTAGTLYKNISFAVQPFLDNTGRFHLESVYVRFDNLLGSRWLNFKVGKFELDTLISERRILTLNNTGYYHSYHFLPPGDKNLFGGLSSNQTGVELLGHSRNSYTRYSLSMLSSDNGQANLPQGHTYDVYGDVNQGFELGRLGLQRVGAYGYFGNSPTYFQTSFGNVVARTGSGSRSYSRTGVYGLWYLGKFDLTTFYLHGQDNVFLGNGVPANEPSNLPPGAAGPVWNGAFAELHHTYNPQLLFISRYELIRMSRQANPARAADYGDQDIWTVGYRWYPFMSSRAGLAWLQEYSRSSSTGTAPLTGKAQYGDSYLMGFDFDF